METIQELSEALNFSDYSSVIVHGLVRALEYSPELRDVAMDTMCCLVVQLGHRFKVFIPMMSKVCRGLLDRPVPVVILGDVAQ